MMNAMLSKDKEFVRIPSGHTGFVSMAVHVNNYDLKWKNEFAQYLGDEDP